MTSNLTNSILASVKHEMVIRFCDEKAGLRGYIAIDNTTLGPATGGTRLLKYESDEQALNDVVRLSHAMTLKCAITGLPYGGGKSVIIADPNDKTRELLKSYAEVINKFNGYFTTGTDVGVSDEDIDVLSKHSPYILGKKTGTKLTTSHCAALGVYNSILAACNELYGSRDLNNRKVGIKGVGKLGGELVKLIVTNFPDSKLIISDIDANKVKMVSKFSNKVKVCPVERMNRYKYDIYAPCALGNEFTTKTVDQLKTKVIAGGANNQLQNSNLAKRFKNKGIVYLPDFLVNSGGLIRVVEDLEVGGYNKNRLIKRIDNIGEEVKRVIRLADSKNIDPHSAAMMIVNKRLQK